MRALITGITGQDGSYLAELLCSKGYEVFGLKRRTSTSNTERIQDILDEKNINLVDGDMCDTSSLARAVQWSRPDEVYNLAAQSFVHTSFNQPEITGEITGLGVVRLLEMVRLYAPKAKFYQASSSEMFGFCPPPQNERSKFHPRSPYGCAKVYGHFIAVNYREAHSMFICNGILFNHESPRRGQEFVTQKIATGVARIKLGRADKLVLGNLDAKRDWGHAWDFVEAMWLMLQQDHPDDYVVGTGESHSVKEFVKVAFDHVGLDWEDYVQTDPGFYRPSEVHHLEADYAKAKKELGWEPKISFEDLVTEMVDAAIKTEDFKERSSCRINLT